MAAKGWLYRLDPLDEYDMEDLCHPRSSCQKFRSGQESCIIPGNLKRG